jgi:hypothetical protein
MRAVLACRGERSRVRILTLRATRAASRGLGLPGGSSTTNAVLSATRDSFMVANLGYLQRADRAGGANVVFAVPREGVPQRFGS